MSNNKQSSVDFYRKNLHSMVSGGSTEFKTEVEIFEQAKEMHREEIIDATCLNAYVNEDDREIGEHYYNETFGGEDEQQ